MKSKINIIMKGMNLHKTMTSSFQKELTSQLGKPILKKFNLRKQGNRLILVMIDTFKNFDMNDVDYTYHPILYKKANTSGVIWIKWCALSDYEIIQIGESVKPDTIEFSLCDEVPERILDLYKSLDLDISILDTTSVRAAISNTVSQIFMYRMSQQIIPQIKKAIGQDRTLPNELKVRISGNTASNQTVFKNDGYSYTTAKLYDKFGVSLEFWVRWKSLNPSIEYIETTNAVITSNSIRFEVLRDVPMDVLLQAKRESRLSYDWVAFARKDFEKGRKFKKSFKFNYRINPHNFPYCKINIVFNCKVDDVVEFELDQFSWSFMETWNSIQIRHLLFKHIIENFSNVKKDPPNTICVYANFGNCNQSKVIQVFLEKMNESFFDIKNIVVE